MSIHDRVDRLIARLHDTPQYPTQGTCSTSVSIPSTRSCR
jgi:hypothetical protein